MRKIHIIFLTRKGEISLISIGVLLIIGVLFHQQHKQKQISKELNVIQRKYDDQQMSISTVVRVLDEIREEKKEAERTAKQMIDSLHNVSSQARLLIIKRDSLIRETKALKNEIKKFRESHRDSDALSPLEQRYRSKKEQRP